MRGHRDMRSAMFERPGRARSPPVKTLGMTSTPAKVKICGITDRAALTTAAEGGADYIGLVFFPKSPRNLSLAQARELRACARDLGVRAVALLVDPTDEALARLVDEIDPDLIQLHGAESVARVEDIRSRWGRPLIKAVSVASSDDAVKGKAYHAPDRLADIILFDAKPTLDADLPGGNGLVFDWHVLEPVMGELPFALAGGLNADNVAEAIRRTGAHIVDVSSGVERAPGVKDVEMIRRFLRAAKGAN